MSGVTGELNQKLQMVRGDAASWMGQAVDPDTVIDGVAQPKNIQGYHIWFTAKRCYDDDDLNAVFQKTELNGITITGNTSGIFTIEPLANADTVTLPNELTGLVFDIQIQAPGGDRTTISRGTLLVSPESTEA